VKRVIILIMGLVVVFIGVGGILPALAKVRDLGAMPGAFVGSYTLGVFLLSVVGATTVCCAMRRRQASMQGGYRGQQPGH